MSDVFIIATVAPLLRTITSTPIPAKVMSARADATATAAAGVTGATNGDDIVLYDINMKI